MCVCVYVGVCVEVCVYVGDVELCVYIEVCLGVCVWVCVYMFM